MSMEFVKQVFEGSEKRLEIDFCFSAQAPEQGLRSLTRENLDTILDKAACCIVSQKSNSHFDAYVLSESSLFVYASKIVIKTCGTTKLLDAAPCILEFAASLKLSPIRCKYSRASYLFPELQPELYQSFAKETQFLDKYFGQLGESGSYILGDDSHGLQWHIYISSAREFQDPSAVAKQMHVSKNPIYTLEVCMTELNAAKAAQFVKTQDFVSAKHTTHASGIASLLPNAEIDDFIFDPCGYSMNGLENSAFSTIHITPEDGQSYASLELCGYPAVSVCPTATVSKAMEIFRPGRVTVSLSVDRDVPACKWPESLSSFPGYQLSGSSAQHFPYGGCHFHYVFNIKEKSEGFLQSPSTVLDGIYGNAGSAGDESDRASYDDTSRSSSPISHHNMDEYETVVQTGIDVPQDMAAVIKQNKAAILDSGNAFSVEARMSQLITEECLEDPLYIVDLGKIARLYKAWVEAMPRVMPFYAVKCFTDKAVISTLAALGAGFDCASESEMQIVMNLGVSADRIVLANCCKRPKDIRFAANAKVQMTTFDTECEIKKLAKMHPNASAILRIRADDPDARCPLGNKYGAEMDTTLPLLEAAKQNGINVVGVSFHVGSGATNPGSFQTAIALAKQAFEQGSNLGFEMSVLDIGGGFTSQSFSIDSPNSIPSVVNQALDKYFPIDSGVRIISEPGRYFTEEAATLGCMVMGIRKTQDVNAKECRDYFITDGLYGSMNSLLYDHAIISARRLGLSDSQDTEMIRCTVFGPTCDGLDSVLKDYPLPELEYGDWLVFPNMGAYTLAGASDFNGMGISEANVSYVYSLAA